MFGSAAFMNKKLTASDETLGGESSTTADITNSAFGFYSWVGMRMSQLSFVSVEGSVGYMYSKLGNEWKAKKGSSNFSGGINMTKPFLRVAAIVGW